MKISARNQFKGKVVKIKEGAVNCIVAVEIAPDVVIRAMVTQCAIEELGLAEGKEACVVIKASSVMVGVED